MGHYYGSGLEVTHIFPTYIPFARSSVTWRHVTAREAGTCGSQEPGSLSIQVWISYELIVEGVCVCVCVCVCV